MSDALAVTSNREIKDLVNEAGRESAGSVRDKYMGYTQGAKGLLRPDDTAEKRMAMNPMNDAIKRKVNQGFGNSQARLKQQIGMDAQVDHLKKLEIASNLASEEHQLNLEKIRIKKEMARAKRAARGQLLGSVLGTVAGVAGTVFSGGNIAVGMAAYKAGEGAGQYVGGR